MADSSISVGVDAALPLAQTILVNQFNGEFFREIAGELVRESSIGALASFIPVIGGIFAMGLDVAIAATMTWRVGTMVSAYYQNGGKWVGGGRKPTYDAVKPLAGGLSPDIANRVDLDDIPNRLQEVFETQVGQAVAYIKGSVLVLAPTASRSVIVEHLVKKGFPKKIAEEAVLRVLGR